MTVTTNTAVRFIRQTTLREPDRPVDRDSATQRLSVINRVICACHGSDGSVVRRGRVNDLRNLGDLGHRDTAELRMRADGCFTV